VTLGVATVRRRLRGAKLARSAVALVSPFGAKLGTLLLRSSAGRKLMNAACERLGAIFGDAFIALFAQARPSSPFLWNCRFAGRSFVLPVAPDLPRSWAAAWTWRWAGNAGNRRFYELYLSSSRGDRVLLDVGANDGLHSYPFAAHGFQCVCFEPQPSNCDYIELTAERNGFASLDVVRSAVGEQDAERVDFFLSDRTVLSSMVRDHVERFGRPQVATVPCVTLDSYCSGRGITPNLVRIDVEGSEWPVLAGAELIVREARPDLFVEVHPTPTKERVWTLLQEELEYRTYYVDRFESRRPFEPITSLPAFVRTSAERAGNFLFARPELASALAPWCR
jgi:FkbM family methyltransferase